MPFTCSICDQQSTRICARCTKDTCDNHLCEKCLRCSDCCECELSLNEPPHLAAVPSVRSALREAEPSAEPQPELAPEP